MELPHTNQNRFQDAIFHSMLPSEIVGDYRIRYKGGSSAYPRLPRVEMTALNEERDDEMIFNTLISPFESEMAFHMQTKPLYFMGLVRRFEQAWQYEDDYTELIKLWEKWLSDEQKGWREKRTELNSLLDTFGFSPGDQGIVLTAEQHEQTKPLYYYLAYFAEKIAEYQHGINRAKDAISIIKQTRTILRHYQPTPTTADAPPVASENAPGEVEDLEPTISITILPDAMPDLIDALTRLIKPEQRKSLKDLISKQAKPAEPIVFLCDQVTIGRIFYPLIGAKDKINRQIQDDKTKIAAWICEHFRYKDSGLVKEFSYQQILKYLTTKRFHE